MKSIKVYARFLELFSLFVVIPFVVVAFLYKWIQPEMPIYSDVADGAKQVRLYAGVLYVYQGPAGWVSAPLLARFLGVIIDGISVGLFCYGCWAFIRLLRAYKQGELFTPRTLAYFMTLSRVTFVWALYNPLKLLLLSIVTTYFNPVGQRVIAFGVTSGDIINIFVVGLFLIIASLMQEASRLQDEHDLTV